MNKKELGKKFMRRFLCDKKAMRSPLNKKGEERFLTPWLFMIWSLIGVAIVAGVLIFYSLKIDVRQNEAEILSTKLIDCIVDNGHLKNLENFEVLEECNIDKDVIWNGDYYFNFSIYEDEKLFKSIAVGTKDFEIHCKLREESEGESFADCFKDKVYALKDNKKIIIKILTASNQLGAKL